MKQTMRRTPIEFSFRFSTEKTECDYTNEWTGAGMPQVGENSGNKIHKNLEPIISEGLAEAIAKVSNIKGDFVLYDCDGNRINHERLDDGKFDFGKDVDIWEYKDDYILKRICQPILAYLVLKFKLNQEIFDLETWLLENLNHAFAFVIDIATERQIGPGIWVDDDDGLKHWVDGTSYLRASPFVSFSDFTDAMGYKMKFL